MLVSEVLKLNSYEQPTGTLKNVVGDGFLLKHNRVYRNVRFAAKKLGFSFVKAWPEYATNGLTQLDRIIETRKIPMNYNRSFLEEIESLTVSPIRLTDIPAQVESHHLHEAAHCIAASVLKGVKAKTVRERIIKAMICESFANAVESMCCAYADNDVHRVFLHMNSYIQAPKTPCEERGRLVRRIGFKNTFCVVLLSYMYSNFLYKELSTRKVRQALSFAESGRRFSALELKNTEKIMASAFQLSLQFRARTNAFYINCMGIEGDILKLLNFDFYSEVVKSKKWSSSIRKLVEIVGQDPS